jgi:glycine/D-amino acid oxidase-like deaminating enzyme
MRYDLIIIGSGSVGSAAGYYATQAGLKVLMIDAHLPPHSEGSHHGDTRLIRHAYGEGERYVPLVLRAQTLWDELAKQTEDRIFERTGVINLGPAILRFSLASNAARKPLIWTLRSWTRRALPHAGLKLPSRTIILASLKPTPACCIAKRRSKPGSILPRRRLRAAVQLSGGGHHP